MLGTKEFGALFSNGFGDGTTTTTVYKRDEFTNNGQWKFIDCVEGRFNLYEYDCCHDRNEDDIVCSFNGRYGVYYKEGELECAIVEWEDWSN